MEQSCHFLCTLVNSYHFLLKSNRKRVFTWLRPRLARQMSPTFPGLSWGKESRNEINHGLPYQNSSKNTHFRDKLNYSYTQAGNKHHGCDFYCLPLVLSGIAEKKRIIRMHTWWMEEKGKKHSFFWRFMRKVKFSKDNHL